VTDARTWRSTFSTTTIASSTNEPDREHDREIVRRFRLKPKASIDDRRADQRDRHRDSGTSAVRIEPRNRNTTTPTIRIVSISVL
jgi:hypothetical protein